VSEEKKENEFQPEIDAAVRWWTRLLSGRLLPGMVAEDLARRGVEAMLAERWRPPLQPPPDWRTRHNQPPAEPTAEWREMRANLAARTRGERT
jgi:hypothetical protein